MALISERENLADALEEMMECTRWEWKPDTRKKFLEALDSYIDSRLIQLSCGGNE